MHHFCDAELSKNFYGKLFQTIANVDDRVSIHDNAWGCWIARQAKAGDQ